MRGKNILLVGGSCIADRLVANGNKVKCVNSICEALARIDSFDRVIFDHGSGLNAVNFLRIIRGGQCRVPVVIISEFSRYNEDSLGYVCDSLTAKYINTSNLGQKELVEKLLVVM